MSLLGIVTINLVGVKQQTSLRTTVNLLVSDLKEQQLKAMVGDTGGRSTADSYGVHFNTDSYVLFHGTSYNSSDTANYTVSLGDNVTVISGNDIIFSQVSGEIGSPVTIVLKENTTKTQRTISLNKYGAVTGVN